ncbi:MAG: helix-turn-helix domain-containing protein [Acetatifactor sp.]|nr:helix-turn-helix domain-containing protein [Acetatifactor sp.]
MTVGQRIVQLRHEKGIYQKELADYLQVSIGTVSNYENGRHYPDPATLCKLAEYFGVTCDYLLGRTTFRFNPEILYQSFTKDFTTSDFVNTVLELSPRNRGALVDYVSLLKLRNMENNSNQ